MRGFFKTKIRFFEKQTEQKASHFHHMYKKEDNYT